MWTREQSWCKDLQTGMHLQPQFLPKRQPFIADQDQHCGQKERLPIISSMFMIYSLIVIAIQWVSTFPFLKCPWWLANCNVYFLLGEGFHFKLDYLLILIITHKLMVVKKTKLFYLSLLKLVLDIWLLIQSATSEKWKLCNF